MHRALAARGYSIHTIYTGDVTTLTAAIQASLSQEPNPAYVILDGHNQTLDENGQPIIDIQPALLMEWLYRQGLPAHVRFVLYSNDDKLLQQVRTDPASGFWTVIAKVGEQGGLTALLRLLKTP